MRVLVAPDKFKGSLSALEVAGAVAGGLRQFQGIVVDCCPVADGGEGFAEALAARFEEVEGIRDALGRPVTARCGWLADAGTAVIEMSEASGIRRLAAAERDPWQASTFGTGQLILHAASRGASRVLVGLGGSATNDAGAGMAAALGWQFLTSDGEAIEPRPANFMAIERIEPPEEETLPGIVAACDVRNPLLGPEGSSRVYARQKGADDRMIDYLEMALEHLAELVADQLGVDHRLLPGAGAAGGLGYGLATFCNAEIQRGFALVAEGLRLEERIAASDLVITGEGCIDAQTFYGKAPAEVARLAKKYDKPVAAVCGRCEAGANVAEWFDFVIAIETLDPGRCFINAPELVARAAGEIARWARPAG
jgi:glycerate kinase